MNNPCARSSFSPPSFLPFSPPSPIMRYLLTFFTILISALLTASVSLSPSPSPVPCAYKCPTKDTANHALASHVEASNPMYCQYGEGYCLYVKVCHIPYEIMYIITHKLNSDQTTGVLSSDHDSGHCPSKAVCATVSRRAALPQSPRQKFARQADTTELKVRDRLGSAKRGKRSV